MSFKTTGEILSGFSLFPQTWTLDNYKTIFTDPSWYWGYVNSIIYVSLNTVISVIVALPAAYAFSRYNFLGDKHLFSGCSPTEWRQQLFLLCRSSSFIQPSGYYSTHIWRWHSRIACSIFRWPSGYWRASCKAFKKSLMKRPLSMDILSRNFFATIFIPTIKAGVGVAAFFCFMFSWVRAFAGKNPHSCCRDQSPP